MTASHEKAGLRHAAGPVLVWLVDEVEIVLLQMCQESCHVGGIALTIPVECSDV